MRFRLVIGFINHLEVVTTINYNTVPDFYTTEHSTLISSVSLHCSSRIYHTGTMQVSLDYTLQVLHINRVFQSHFKSSQVDELSSSTMNSELSTQNPVTHQPTISLQLTLLNWNCTNCELFWTYTAEGWTLTNSKHISRDPLATVVWRQCWTCGK
jgi:hypothetical protein